MALERGTPSAKSVEKRASIDSLTYDKGSAKPNDYETPWKCKSLSRCHLFGAHFDRTVMAGNRRCVC